MEAILQQIKSIRTEIGYSQEYVANKMDMEQSGYALIEKGKRKLKYEQLEQIAIIFNMNVIDVITYPEKYVPLNKAKEDPVEAILQIKLNGNKKEQVLSLVLGDNHLEILNK